MTQFERRLQLVFTERQVGDLKIVGVRFHQQLDGMIHAMAIFDDGVTEQLFQFDPDLVSFLQQELIGLTREEALYLKDWKTDKAVGLEAPG